MLEFLTQIFHSYGYLIVFLGAISEGIILVTLIIPGVLMVLLGGYFSHQDLSLPVVVLLSTIGLTLGDMASYYLGAHISKRFLGKTRLGKYILQKEQTSRNLLNKYGATAIFYSHIAGYLRTIVCFTAGFIHYDKRKYLVATFLSSFVWSLSLVLLGFFFAKSTGDVSGIYQRLFIFIVGLLLVFAVIHFLQFVFKKVFVFIVAKKKNGL